MTGTVTGITGYQWHAGGQWPVISANCSRISARIPVVTGVRQGQVLVVWPIQRLWKYATSAEWRFPILNFGTRDSSCSWSLS